MVYFGLDGICSFIIKYIKHKRKINLFVFNQRSQYDKSCIQAFTQILEKKYWILTSLLERSKGITVANFTKIT